MERIQMVEMLGKILVLAEVVVLGKLEMVVTAAPAS